MTGIHTQRLSVFPPRNEGRPLGWVPYVWMLYAVNFLLVPIVQGASPPLWAATIIACAVFVVSYLRGLWVTGRVLLVEVGVQLALAIGFAPFNAGSSVFFVYAAAAAARLERQRHAIALIAAITLLGLLTVWLADGMMYGWIAVAIFTPLIGAVNFNAAQAARADAKLRLAHTEIERLATVAERERIARDLHDVLGHTLTLIVLKAELASRLADREPTRALQEIREVEQVSRKALGEVREAISGYRANWDDEVGRARAMLGVAGIAGSFTGRPTVLLARASEEAVALGLREAVTNVVRHSRATRCEVRWEDAGDRGRLVVADDGHGGIAAEGNGLRGIRERAEAVGGRVQREPWHEAAGTRLTITIPVGRA